MFHRLDVKRRYTFYCERETIRSNWHEAIVDAMGVRNTEREVNKVRKDYVQWSWVALELIAWG